ncbi:tRNA lysidine(34) synthetase TilS [Anoxybacillus sp. ST4]|uniref:tRNA lysidine(34) synthetase TilS n=1 Tax=Anoxybacillus sp. ST4 TaxID=2864181 RepID=UPI001C640A23|nr:tRNA lysidine(34) synthetase TilS [Anoxybacillus sp. ST4]MBW7651631.1 tRNA lysidine(34) synthetase TilS [Anoxybacillus sp. ST4]
MLQVVHQFIEKHQLLECGTTVVVGVSGGPDSLALLHFLWSERERYHIQIVVAHVDHMLRGKQSEEDMHFVKHFCEQRSIICEVTKYDVRAYMKRTKKGVQEAARDCRYDFFEQVMKKYKARYIALAHHGDDQVETVLMRLVRGSTPKGYAGIPVKRPFGDGYIIRPFLCIDRQQIEQYCQENELYARHDPSNDKDDYTRNRFRHHVLPFLKRENVCVHEHVQQFSEIVSEDEAFLEQLTKEKLKHVMNEQEGRIRVDVPSFMRMPKPLQRRGIQLILNYLYGNVPSTLSSIHIEQVLRFFERKHPSGMLHFPNGLKMIRQYEACIFTFQYEQPCEYEFVMHIPDTIMLPNGYQLMSEFVDHYPCIAGDERVVIDMDQVVLPLRVRTRKHGDRMKVKGMEHAKKVGRIFIDEKVPMNERDQWPIVEDANGNIIWIPGIKKSAYTATNITKNRYIVLHYKKQ